MTAADRVKAQPEADRAQVGHPVVSQSDYANHPIHTAGRTQDTAGRYLASADGRDLTIAQNDSGERHRVTAKANERTTIADQSEPFKGGREKIFDSLKGLIPDLESGKLTQQGFADKINKLFKDRGLPPLSIEANRPEGQTAVLGDYIPGQAKLQLSLRGQNASTLLGEVAHEITHAEQDVLMIRSMMDDQHVGRKMTADQLKKVKEDYKTKVGVEPADSWLQSVADARQGKQLTPNERKRANELVAATGDAVKNPFEPPNRMDREILSWMKDDLSDPRKAAKAVAQMAIDHAQDGNLISQAIGKMLFKNPNYTKEDVIKAFGDPSSPDFNEPRAHQEIGRRLSEYEQESQAQYNKYRGRKHESEAFENGEQFLKRLNRPIDRSQCSVIDGKVVCRTQ